MADTMQFDLVSPERRLASLEASEVRIPGAEGDMTALPDHTPVITTLRPGVVAVTAGGTESKYFVVGGFAEITPEGVSVLAEQALPVGEVTSDWINQLLSDTHSSAKEQAKSAGETLTDDALKLLADMVAAGQEIGLDPVHPER